MTVETKSIALTAPANVGTTALSVAIRQQAAFRETVQQIRERQDEIESERERKAEEKSHEEQQRLTKDRQQTVDVVDSLHNTSKSTNSENANADSQSGSRGSSVDLAV